AFLGQPGGDGHGLEFTRYAIHLAARACHAGRAIDLPSLRAAGPAYGMSNVRAYHQALGDEPDRLREKTFADIAATEPPKEFAALWRHDSSFFARTTK